MSELLLKELEDLIERRAQSAICARHSAEALTPAGLKLARKVEIKKLIAALDTLMGRRDSVELLRVNQVGRTG
jgi:phage terminase small subunit